MRVVRASNLLPMETYAENNISRCATILVALGFAKTKAEGVLNEHNGMLRDAKSAANIKYINENIGNVRTVLAKITERMTTIQTWNTRHVEFLMRLTPRRHSEEERRHETQANRLILPFLKAQMPTVPCGKPMSMEEYAKNNIRRCDKILDFLNIPYSRVDTLLKEHKEMLLSVWSDVAEKYITANSENTEQVKIEMEENKKIIAGWRARHIEFLKSLTTPRRADSERVQFASPHTARAWIASPHAERVQFASPHTARARIASPHAERPRSSSLVRVRHS
jgi:hypothetical protein